MINLPGGQAFAPEYLLKGSTLLALVFISTLVFLTIGPRKEWPFARKVVYLLFLIYLGCTFSLTLFPINIFTPSNAIHNLPFGMQTNVVNLSPLAWAKYDLLQSVGNILLLVPLGFLLPILSQRFSSLGKITFTGLLLSLTIESTQLAMNFFYLGNRIFDMSDLFLNTAGCIIGWFSFYCISRLFPNEIQQIQL
ncbi:VanZ family protein [Lacticaseibacillus songhuajiangensis]|jgi:glycopeptide antibiotics resistance protein|uniref:VanZ family protein n=1 Tax=Lacticaseibacillus songhuajiangensis TaxID=1296539 RepID=UPI000F78D923|nr:VanZ family protein [Lacticaseibacillus songhuajiangensis]